MMKRNNQVNSMSLEAQWQYKTDLIKIKQDIADAKRRRKPKSEEWEDWGDGEDDGDDGVNKSSRGGDDDGGDDSNEY